MYVQRHQCVNRAARGRLWPPAWGDAAKVPLAPTPYTGPFASPSSVGLRPGMQLAVEGQLVASELCGPCVWPHGVPVFEDVFDQYFRARVHETSGNL